MASRVALVTGGNKGIGLNVARQLAFKDWRVILTSRNLENASAALRDHFDTEFFPRKNVDIMQLDITDQKSIENAANEIEKRYNSSIDVLINNAGIAFRENQFDENVINQTLETNFYGTVNVTKALLPFVKERVCFVTSRAGALKQYSQQRIDRFMDDNLTENDLDSIFDEFKSDAKKLNYSNSEFEFDAIGWTPNAYALSKAAISMYSRMLTKQLWYHDKRRLFVASYCPGSCRTDMTYHIGDRSAVEGAYGLTTLCSMLLDYQDDELKMKHFGLGKDDLVPFDAETGHFWTAFYSREGDLNSIELEQIDWVNPSNTISWQNILHNIVIRRGKK